MNVDALLPIIVVLFFIFAGVIKRLVERFGEQVDEGADTATKYEAPPDEVRAFLQSLQAPGRPQVAAEAPHRAAESPLVLGLPLAEGRARRAPSRVEVGAFVPAERPEAVRTVLAPPLRPEAPPGRRPEARRAPTRARAAEVRKEVTPVEAAMVARFSRITPLALGRFGLKQAVVWSEILGAPVSLRRRSHRPSALRH